MAKPINYVSELSEQEALAFIKAEKEGPSHEAKKLLKAASKLKISLKDLL